MFRPTTIIRSLHMSLSKVIFIKSVKVRRYGLQLCGSMLYQVHGGVFAVCCAEFHGLDITCCYTTA